jgi:hypothetical protein
MLVSLRVVVGLREIPSEKHCFRARMSLHEYIATASGEDYRVCI